MALILLALGGLLAGVVAWWLGRQLHRPPRMTGGRALARLGRLTPADVGMNYEPLAFDVPREPDMPATGRLRLMAWRLPHPAESVVTRTVVLLHGYGDSKIGALAWAPVWQRLGFHVLLIDLRGHGESDAAWCSGGVHESADVVWVAEQLRELHPTTAQKIVLAGISFGGLVALAAAARMDGQAGVVGVVADSPVRSWPEATARWCDWMGMPLQRLLPMILRGVERRLGVDFGAASVPTSLKRLTAAGRAALVILPNEDAFGDATAGVVVDGSSVRQWRPAAGHNEAVLRDPEAYEAALRGFIEAAPPAGDAAQRA